ncbi:transmembrane protein 205, partial [Plakobranchus ocellatus]
MEHFQFCAVAVVICFASMQLFPLLTRRSHQESLSEAEPGVANGMLHLGSFGANFGAQMWVTFVAGLTMFYSLPRHMFGKVQSRLFPMFYLWSLVCSAVTLSTFLERHPYDTWDSSLFVR